MNKLIELLLEYKPQIHYLDKPKGVYDKKYGIGWYKREGDIGGWFSEEVIISKKFGFIKRIVEKDKIEFPTKVSELTLELRNSYVLKYLRISDTPINFLISVLK